jgi:hypothetical protein
MSETTATPPSESSSLDIRKQARRRTVLFVLMDIVTIGFYVLAAVIGLAVPIAAVVWFRYHFGKDWPDHLPQYQALFGGLAALFAASLAAVGVALTIANQRRVTNRQMAAQLREQDLVRTLAKRQIASAFIGEIEVALDELRHQGVKPVLEKAVDDLTNGRQTSLVQIGHFGKYYDSDRGNVGLFAGDVPEELTRFYGTLEGIRGNLEWLFRAWTGQLSINTPRMIDVIKETIRNIDSCAESGPDLVRKLKEIRGN